ncbi:mitochondrial intermembrane space import and assembly protein 40 [Choristoneura fumiferana]|uniref:mitochondrial intermembrane space import and assembly protein 40 n=1 Tax=Choristoneura fumiferana TaxID=7141 RepID=UPI003D1587AC
MSVVRLQAGPAGKDAVLVAARGALEAPARVALPEPEPAPGLILADGSINWGCPCLGGMATGPCAQPFRDAFSCFHYSEADPKGSDCYDKFSDMQTCMAQYPDLYGKDDDDDGDGGPAPPGKGDPPAPAGGQPAPAPAGETKP